MRRSAVAVVVVVGLVIGCGGGDARVTGVVLYVDGDLTSVRSFQVLGTDGERYRFVPGPDLHAFPDGTALTHLYEHLQTAAPIRVTFRIDDGVAAASIVEDAP